MGPRSKKIRTVQRISQLELKKFHSEGYVPRVGRRQSNVRRQERERRARLRGSVRGARDETRVPTATKAGGRNAARSAGYAFVPWPAKIVTKGSSTSAQRF